MNDLLNQLGNDNLTESVNNVLSGKKNKKK